MVPQVLRRPGRVHAAVPQPHHLLRAVRGGGRGLSGPFLPRAAAGGAPGADGRGRHLPGPAPAGDQAARGSGWRWPADNHRAGGARDRPHRHPEGAAAGQDPHQVPRGVPRHGGEKGHRALRQPRQRGRGGRGRVPALQRQPARLPLQGLRPRRLRGVPRGAAGGVQALERPQRGGVRVALDADRSKLIRPLPGGRWAAHLPGIAIALPAS
mmetsp:Transcript_45719/g.115551  ORF Transcript_45719/g.115551 Transcript_45719/m.115551 type:complete len:211 (-) Transcript_45719:27-659(-)